MEQKKEVRLDEKRFLNIDEFAAYTSLGKNTARELANQCEVVLHVKSRFLVDRIKFDGIDMNKIEELMPQY